MSSTLRKTPAGVESPAQNLSEFLQTEKGAAWLAITGGHQQRTYGLLKFKLSGFCPMLMSAAEVMRFDAILLSHQSTNGSRRSCGPRATPMRPPCRASTAGCRRESLGPCPIHAFAPPLTDCLIGIKDTTTATVREPADPTPTPLVPPQARFGELQHTERGRIIASKLQVGEVWGVEKRYKIWRGPRSQRGAEVGGFVAMPHVNQMSALDHTVSPVAGGGHEQPRPLPVNSPPGGEGGQGEDGQGSAVPHVVRRWSHNSTPPSGPPPGH